ncbi:MAG: hypothetical protein M3083_14215 [Actinomycetota bacterium]|nr:hypothetical protein [Actinomycetota bacterium]
MGYGSDFMAEDNDERRHEDDDRWRQEEIKKQIMRLGSLRPAGFTAQEVTDAVNDATVSNRPHGDPHTVLFGLSEVQAVLEGMVVDGALSSGHYPGRIGSYSAPDELRYRLVRTPPPRAED